LTEFFVFPEVISLLPCL